MNAAEAFAAYEGVRQRLPAVQRSAACKWQRNLDAIADAFDVFLLDAFGVLNIGETAIESVPERVAGLQQAGKSVLVVSNAAGQPHASLMAKYERLGYDFAPDDVITSRKTMLHALSMEASRHWGMMVTENLGLEDLEHLDGTCLAEERDVYASAEGFLMIGSGTWTEKRQELLEGALSRTPRPVLVGNPDIVAPREDSFSREPGSFAHQLADRTGIAPRFFGKPFKNIFDLAFGRLGPGYNPERIVMVGDSLHTDILGGQTAGIKTALIAQHGFFNGLAVEPYLRSSGILPDYILDAP